MFKIKYFMLMEGFNFLRESNKHAVRRYIAFIT